MGAMAATYSTYRSDPDSSVLYTAGCSNKNQMNQVA